MRVGGVNNNFFRQDTVNKKHTVQDKQHEDFSENAISDPVEISADETQEKRKSYAMELEDIMSQLENIRSQGKSMADSARVRMKCLMIAARIMSGDIVPNADQRYLAENDLELYSRAVSLRVVKENPKKHKSIVDDEETKSAKNAVPEITKAIQPENVEVQTEASADSAASSED